VAGSGKKGFPAITGGLLLAAVVVAVAVFVLPVVGAGWGLWVVGTWLARRGAEAAPSTPRAILAGAVALISVVVAVTVWPAMLEDEKPAVSAARAVPPAAEPVTVTVPDVAGELLPAAGSAMYEADLRSANTDLSPRGRQVMSPGNWTVVTTEPAAGAQVSAGSGVTLFVLKTGEAQWFAAHPTMPKLPKGSPVSELTDHGGPLEGMYELVELRYTRRSAPADARPADETPGRMDWRGTEPATEKRARAGLKEAPEYGTLVVGSIPIAGRGVRTGRLIVVTVKPAPKDRVPNSGSGGGVYIPLPDDDDDFNVPGRLCPTRWC
jgi:hypothetical protein